MTPGADRRLGLIIVAVMALTTGGSFGGVDLPTGFVASPLATGLNAPTAMVLTPDGRVLIAQQGGELRIWHPATGLQAAAAHDFDVDSQGERGFIGIEIDPAFANNRRVYAHISRAGPSIGGSIRRVTLNAAGTAVDAASETEIFYIGDYSSATNHNGGAMHFGADGKLYISVGENATTSHAQSLANLFGKILRINADGSIPTDNPTSLMGVAGSPTGQNRAIWALGLRNPFTFAIQPGTGRMFINDVGAGTWEEVNEGAAGRNFGWPTTEGPFSASEFPSFSHPLVYYHHSNPDVGRPASPDFTGFAVAGGAFYNPATASFPASHLGDYFFGDLRGWVKRFDPSANTVDAFAGGLGPVVDLRVDPSGHLLILDRSGTLRRISFCRADFNASGDVSVQDIFDFLAAYFGNEPAADFNGASGISVQDIFDFLEAYFTPC